MPEALADRLFLLFQRLLPERLLGRGVYRLARCRTPWFKNLAIRFLVKWYGIDLSEVARRVPDEFQHLNDFFTRELRPGARPLTRSGGVVVSPADGRLEEVGFVAGDELVQAKTFRYRLADLLATDATMAERYRGGALLTVYLAPHDYHRVHLPLEARIVAMDYVPGRRWAVNSRSVRTVPGLFAVNERVILWCESPWGPYALVLVGALNVASISVPWAGEVAPPPGHGPRRWTYPAGSAGMDFAAGDLVGQFNLGSTVVVVAGRGMVAWENGIRAGAPVRMGEALGRVSATAGPAPGFP